MRLPTNQSSQWPTVSSLSRHPPYSSDLAPSDYLLFPNMKKHLAGRHNWSDEKMRKSVDLKGDFVEK